MVANQDADSNEDRLASDLPSSTDPNPFAPVTVTSTESTLHPSASRLTGAYWVAWGVMCVASVALIFVMPFWGIALLAATIMSGIRVPLLFRRLARRAPTAPAKSSIVVLFTSMLLNLAMGGASLVTFVVICLPVGFVSFTLFEKTTAESSILSAVFGGSALVALIVYFVLFRLSLRLNA
ncbi:MAG: hypothetical protein AAGG44_02410 [Planctomycetota bacterium]